MPDIQWGKLKTLEYWFEGIAGDLSVTAPVEDNSWFFWFYLSAISAVFTVGVLIRIFQGFLHESHPLQKKLPTWGNNVMWMGFTGSIWFLARQTSVGFLGARFWILVIFGWLSVLLFFVVRYFVLNYKIEIIYFKKTNSAKQVN